MQKAIGYIRVSTQGQADEGVSLAAQRAKIEAWCSLNDAELVKSADATAGAPAVVAFPVPDPVPVADQVIGATGFTPFQGRPWLELSLRPSLAAGTKPGAP